MISRAGPRARARGDARRNHNRPRAPPCASRPGVRRRRPETRRSGEITIPDQARRRNHNGPRDRRREITMGPRPAQRNHNRLETRAEKSQLGAGRRQALSRPASRARDNACARRRETHARGPWTAAGPRPARTRTRARPGVARRPLAASSQGRVVVPYPSREHARVPSGLHSVPTRPLLRKAPREPRTGGYPVDPAGSIRLPQRLSHACPVQASTAKLRTAHYTSGNVRGGPC